MNEDWQQELFYIILPGNPNISFQHAGIHKKAFDFWLQYWLNTCSETKLSTEIIESDDFFRHQYINILVHKDEIVAMINCSSLDFGSESSSYHSYIKSYFNEEFVQEMQKLELKNMLTMENIVAHKNWRSSNLGLSLGGVMLSLALKKSLDAGYDGGFGAARADAPTAKLSYELGGRPIVKDLEFHGKPTDLIAWSKKEIKDHPIPKVKDLVSGLWNSRFDTTTSSETQLQSVAA